MQPGRAKCLAAAGDCFVSHPSTPSCPPYVPANSSGMTHRPSLCTFLSADRPFLKLDSTFVGSVTGEGEELQTHVPSWCHSRVWKGFFQDGEDDLSPSSACPWPCCCRMMSVPVLQEDRWGILPHSMRARPWEMRMLWVSADSIITPERNDIPLWNHRDLLLLLKSQICVNSAI